MFFFYSITNVFFTYLKVKIDHIYSYYHIAPIVYILSKKIVFVIFYSIINGLNGLDIVKKKEKKKAFMRIFLTIFTALNVYISSKKMYLRCFFLLNYKWFKWLEN